MFRFAVLLLGLCWSVCALADRPPHAPSQFHPVHYGNDTLSAVLAAKKLRCGMIATAEDYSMASTHDDLSDFGADLCRATAAALLGDKNAVVLLGYPDDAHGLRALHEGGVDIVFGVAPDAASALPYDVMFAPAIFYDAQGFMTTKAAGITDPAQLAHKLLCFITGTSQEERMNNWRAVSGVDFYAHDFQERGEMEAALDTGNCAAITDNLTDLARMRLNMHRAPQDFIILPQVIAMDPWAPALRAGDVRLNAVLTDVMTALVRGEELGITAANVGQKHAGADLLLNPTPGIKATLGMPDFWARRAIAAGGNYGEIFARDVGAASPYRLPRGLNALWSQGGMIMMPPLR